MRVLAVLLAACLFLVCTSKPVPERQVYKRDDASSDGKRGKLSRDFNVVDDMLSTLDRCFRVLQEAVDECGEGGNNPMSKSQELSDEREESDERRTGSKTEPQTEPPTTPPTTPPRVYTGPAVIIVHSQEEELEKTADQQGIGNRDKERGRASEAPPPTQKVIVHVDRGGKPESEDESAKSQALHKDDDSLFDRDDRKEEEEKPHPTANVIVVHVDRGNDGNEAAGASSQSVGKDRDKGRDDGDDEKPTPDVIVIHINRKEDTSQDAVTTLPAVEQSRRKPTEAPTNPTTALPTSENPPPRVIIIHTDGKTVDGNEEAEAEGLRRTEATEPPTEPPSEPPTHRSIPSTDVIIIHHDRPSAAEIQSDVEYALRYWSERRSTDPPTEATQAPPTTRPTGPARIIIIPDARDESIDEIVSRVNAYSVEGRFRFRNKNNEEEESTETPTGSPVGSDGSPLIIVIDRRPNPTTTTSTETQTEPPPDDSLAIKTIQLAAKKLKVDTLLKPVSSQAEGDVNEADVREGKERFDPDRIDLDDLRERKKKIELELEREGMFMYPVAQESSREKDDRSKNDSADSRDDSSGRRNKTTDVTDLPTEEPSATIETDISNSPTNDDSTTSSTEEPSTDQQSQSNSTVDTEEPSDSTTATTHDTDSDTGTHSPDTTSDTPTHNTEQEAEAGEWPMESVFYEHSRKSPSVKSKKTGVMDKALEDYLHFRKRRQGDSFEFTPQQCLQLFSSIIETHYADKLNFLNK